MDREKQLPLFGATVFFFLSKRKCQRGVSQAHRFYINKWDHPKKKKKKREHIQLKTKIKNIKKVTERY
jgi:hypothetical protein